MEALPEGKRPAYEAHPNLNEILEEKCRVARAAYAAFNVPAADFVREIAERCARGDLMPEQVIGEDLYLCVACLLGIREAHEVFERTVIAKLRAVMRKTAAPEVVEETIQRLRISLFLPTSRRPAKAQIYTGKVPLSGWLRLVVQREFASVLRSAKAKRVPESAKNELLQMPAPSSAEGEYFRQVNDAAMKRALTGAFRALEPGDRELLTWLVREGASIDVIGQRLKVHRATAARMIGRAKARLLESVREILRADLKANDASLDSICASMAVRLDVSLDGIINDGES